jgi:hypothetical protein
MHKIHDNSWPITTHPRPSPFLPELSAYRVRTAVRLDYNLNGADGWPATGATATLRMVTAAVAPPTGTRHDLKIMSNLVALPLVGVTDPAGVPAAPLALDHPDSGWSARVLPLGVGGVAFRAGSITER